MKALRRMWKRIAGSFTGRNRDAELANEFESHIAMLTEKNLRRGMSQEQARRAAILTFGGVEPAKESYRDQRGLPAFDSLQQDVRFGLRMLRKSPSFTAVAVLTLALGIGANTAIFSLIDAVMLRSLPVANPSQLMLLEWTARRPPNTHGYWSGGDCASDSGFGVKNSGCSFSEPIFREIAQSNAFSGTAAFAGAGRLNLTGNGQATVINGQLVSGDFFRTMGVKAAVGRVIAPMDDSRSSAPVAMLNYGYWQSAFGGSRDAIGRTIEINRAVFTIIGVAEPRFTGISPGSDYDMWMPLADGERISTSGPASWNHRQDDVAFWWLTIVGRLKPGAQPTQTQAEVSGIFRNEMLHGPVLLFTDSGASGAPAPGTGWGAGGGVPSSKVAASARTSSTAAEDPEVSLVSAQTGLTGQRGRYSDPLYVLMFAVGIILLIACANVAGLILARSGTRKTEMAVRLALGAGRTRIVRQLLTESIMLSVMGGVLGVLFAYWGANAIVSFVSSNQPRPIGFATGIDVRVLGFTVAVSLVSGILFGIAPAFRSVRVDLAPALKDSKGRSASPRYGSNWFSIGNGLVVAQVALAAVVLVGAGLLVRTLENLRRVDPGFSAHNIIIFSVDPTLAGYNAAQVENIYRALQSRLAETPSVKAVSYSLMPPLTGGMTAMSFRWPGTPQDRESIADMLPVGPDFFETLHIPFLAGHGFSATDFELSAANGGNTPTSAPTPVIVNQVFVANFLGKQDPLAKRFGESKADANGPANPGYEIVGVVRDTKYSDLRRDVHATIYGPQSHGPASFEVRTATDPQTAVPMIRKAVAEVNANLPLFNVRTESEQIDLLLFQERLVARLSGFFGALALTLACVGLYGLISYEVARRTHEIGIRMALGATPRQVLRLLFRDGMSLVALGLTLGVVLAYGFARTLTSVLYATSPSDLTSFAAAVAILGVVGFAACYIPARRATRVDPMVALRHE